MLFIAMRALLVPALVMLGLVAPPAAAADKLEPAVIVFIDQQLILRESEAAKSIRKQIDGFRVAYREDIVVEEKRLRVEEQELKRQRPLLSPEAFTAKRRLFEDSVASVQRSVQDRTRLLDRAYTQSMNEVGKVMRVIVAELTQEMGFNIVLEKSQILFARRNLDITQHVLERLNKKLRHVEVPSPQSAPDKQ